MALGPLPQACSDGCSSAGYSPRSAQCRPHPQAQTCSVPDSTLTPSVGSYTPRPMTGLKPTPLSAARDAALMRVCHRELAGASAAHSGPMPSIRSLPGPRAGRAHRAASPGKGAAAAARRRLDHASGAIRSARGGKPVRARLISHRFLILIRATPGSSSSIGRRGRFRRRRGGCAGTSRWCAGCRGRGAA
jgi:hypothetical protein